MTDVSRSLEAHSAPCGALTAPRREATIWGNHVGEERMAKWMVSGLWIGCRGEQDLIPVGRLVDHQRWERHWLSIASPPLWLVVVVLAIAFGLVGVGYLVTPELPETLAEFDRALGARDVPFDSSAAQRGAFAISGVLLGITMALTAAAFYWTFAAARGHTLRHLGLSAAFVAIAAAIMCLLAYGIYGFQWLKFFDWQPYDSMLARHLLSAAELRTAHPRFAGDMPNLMFLLATFVPLVLTLGACFLIEGLRRPRDEDKEGREQLKILVPRLRQLDQMLYIGALTLVAGTLQLASALSIPLASMPSVSETKISIEMCKSFMGRDVGNPFYLPATPVPSAPSTTAFRRGFGPTDCQDVADAVRRLSVADGIRQLIHALTLSFGLAFSAMLACIYLPAFICLRQMIDRARDVLRGTAPPEAQPGSEGAPDTGEIDPLRRIAAILATLGPLIAGLLANTLTPAG
jgi:hypothetical protein